MAIRTFGTMAVDWEQRVDFERLRTQRLARLKAQLERSDLGALLSFDMSNTRYMTATHIGTWAMDKLIRFALLPRGGDPVVWDFGSAARHHQLYNPWLDHTPGEPTAAGAARTGARAGVSTLRGAFHPDFGIARELARTIAAELREHGLAGAPIGIDVAEMPVLAALAAEGIQAVDGQQVFLEARRIKTADEITLLTQACSMVDAAYDELYEFLRPGVRENECVGLVSKVLYDLGSEYVEGVNAISGERCSPHPHVFSDRILRPGDPAFFDIAITVRSRWAAPRRLSAMPTPGAGSTWTRRLPWSGPGRARPRSCRSGLGPRTSVSPTRPPRSRCSMAMGLVCPYGRNQSSAGWSPWTTLRSWRRGWCSRLRPTGQRPTAGRPRGSRRRSW